MGRADPICRADSLCVLPIVRVGQSRPIPGLGDARIVCRLCYRRHVEQPIRVSSHRNAVLLDAVLLTAAMEGRRPRAIPYSAQWPTEGLSQRSKA